MEFTNLDSTLGRIKCHGLTMTGVRHSLQAADFWQQSFYTQIRDEVKDYGRSGEICAELPVDVHRHPASHVKHERFVASLQRTFAEISL